MRYLATPVIASAGPPASVLLAEAEFASNPVEILVTGSKGDKTAQLLFRAAVAASPIYKRVEWWDPAEGNLPRDGLTYPASPRVGAILCGNSGCSQPISDPKVFAARVADAVDW